MTGILYIVATPIGNLQDMSLRALAVLKEVDFIAAEDTRHSKRLLMHFDIHTPVLSLHAHNEDEKNQKLMEMLQNNKQIALISDAGTPLISDPGYRLVSTAHEMGIKVVPVPGACAAMTALCASGLPTDRFYFAGFLPSKSQARINRLNEFIHYSATLILYEAPHRIVELIEDIVKVMGPTRRVGIARELTKKFETIYTDEAIKVLSKIKSHDEERLGEFVVMISSKSQDHSAEMEEALRVYDILANELPMKQAVKLAAEVTGIKKNSLYEEVLRLKDKLSH